MAECRKKKKFSDVLIVSDYDGTLAYNGKIPQGNIEAIKYFNDNGGMFALASGRAEFILDLICPEAREICNAPSVLSNGSYLYDFQNDERLFETFVAEEPYHELLNDIHSYDAEAGIRIIRDGTMITPDRTPEIEFQIKNGYVKEITEYTFDTIPSDKVNKITVCADKEKILRMQEGITEKYSAYYNITKSADRILEIQSKEVSKGLMVEKVREVVEKRYKTKRRLFCVGNFENDIDLLEKGDFSCCPADSLDLVVKMCDIVLCDCKDSAIADLIRKIENKEVG